MKCPRCQQDNPPHARFCLGCGAHLTVACGSCGAELPGGARFCLQCGHAVAAGTAAPVRSPAPDSYTPKHLAEKILTSKAALEGERKQVTVLFADLKGSMELLADRDPEEARNLLDPVLEHMMEAVHRYEGTVNQVMGDGIMALFGAPIAHEDHAVRACYAGLRMQETVNRYAEGVRRAGGAPIQIRIGLNSGEVVVRSIGSDLHMDYTAVGQTTHLAARMEQMAMPGSLLITLDTLRLVEGYVVVKSLGAMPVKGLRAPTEVYEVAGAATVRSRLHVAAARGLTRFVGRDSEVEQLRQALDLARIGRGQVAAVMGEPGVGKSRLFWEFIQSHRTEGWLIVESSPVSYGKATAFLPLIDLLRAYFQIEPRDEAWRIREKVTGKLLSLDQALKPSLPAFLWLLDVPVDDLQWEKLEPPQRHQQTLDGVRRLLLRESQTQPVLIVFEDLHWIDAETQAFLDSLVESLPAARLLLLVNYRPEYQHGWSAKTYYQQLRIDTLLPTSADEMLDGLLGNDPGLGSLKQLLIDRTGGNPFFLEESVRTLVETQALAGERAAYRLAKTSQTFQIPATAQAVLASRIDRLSPEHKRLLQAAAVIGKDVPYSLLQAVAEGTEEALRHGIARLMAGEFLYEARLFPDLEYTFKHALINDVAYGSLLHDRRRVLHARIVDAIERLFPQRLDENVERLAHHSLRGEDWGKAVTYCRQAGIKVGQRTAYREACRYFEEALSALKRLPEGQETLEQEVDIRFDLRLALQPLGQLDRALDVLHEAEHVASALRDERRLGRVWLSQSNLVWVTASIPRAIALAERALTVAQRSGDLALSVAANYTLGATHGNAANFSRAIECFTACISALKGQAARERFGLPSYPSVSARAFLAMMHACIGEFAACSQVMVETMSMAEELDHPFSTAFACWGCGTSLVLQGNAEKAIAILERGSALAREWSIHFLWPLTAGMLGYARVLAGQVGEGIPLMEQALSRADAMAFRNATSFLMPRMSEAYLLAGDVAEAGRSAGRALSTARSRGERIYEAEALSILGGVAAKHYPADTEAAEGNYRNALALASECGLSPLVAHCHLGLGKLYRRTGKRQEAQEHLTTATTMYRDMDMQFWLEQAAVETAAL